MKEPINTQSERQSNFELMRIIMMLLIIAHHYVVNSGIINLYDYTNLTSNMITAHLIGLWGKVMINGFIIITGYFMVKKKITLKKILKLILEVVFYNILFYIIFSLSGYETLTIKRIN